MYVRLSRSGLTTRDLVLELARLFGLKDLDVGAAGLKDKQAVATQTFSLFLPRDDPAEVGRRVASALPVKVAWAKRHVNKLKTGHLLGNRFTITLTGTGAGHLEPARRLAAAIMARGLPNFYGAQRFGAVGDNADRGRALIGGRGPRSGFARRLLLSAFQAGMFNEYLAERLARDWFNRLLIGDLAKKTDTGGLFPVEDREAEQIRFDSGALTHTGPIYGGKMRWAQGLPGALEQEILERHEVTPEQLKKAGLDGSRRPGRLNLPEISIQVGEAGLVFDFALPKGSYATILMREFTREDPTDIEPPLGREE